MFPKSKFDRGMEVRNGKADPRGSERMRNLFGLARI